MPIYFNEKYKSKKKLKMKKNAMDPVNFEEERKNDPKYKTELCKKFMETNFCEYGNKCRFAHGYNELVVKKQINHYKQKLCNSFFNKGYCPYGSRCNFKHDERKIQQIPLPYYFSHLISLHLPQLKTCKRLNAFIEINEMKNELDQKWREINNEIIEEEENEKEKLSNSFSSDNSSQATSTTDSPSKEHDKDGFDTYKITDFFLKDLNFELEFFSTEN